MMNEHRDDPTGVTPTDHELASLGADWEELRYLAEFYEDALDDGLDIDVAMVWLESGFTFEETAMFLVDAVPMEIAELWVQRVDDTELELMDLRHLWVDGIHPFDRAVHDELGRWDAILEGEESEGGAVGGSDGF